MDPLPPPAEAETAWRAWRKRREAALRAPDGWLALVGLHWLSILPGGPVKLGPPVPRSLPVQLSWTSARRSLLE